MQTIVDKIFGQLYYASSWEKKEILYFGNTKRQITVVVEAYPNQEITDVQRHQYLEYQQKKEEFVNILPNLLLEYYLDNYDDISSYMEIPEQINKENINEQLMLQLVRINDLYIARDERYGWLCDCAWDEEHGLCVLLSDKEPHVVEQDVLI